MNPTTQSIIAKSFDENGNLISGIHTYDPETFISQFIKGFPASDTRQQIFDNFLVWLKKLILIAPPNAIWLDGSYLTQKVNPNDIDLIAFYIPEDLPNEAKAKEVQAMFGAYAKQFKCDAYHCLTFDHWPSEQQQRVDDTLRTLRTYWMGQFGFDRNRHPKGLVEFLQDDIIKLGGEGA
ncbi:hypothetical protein BRE01_31250 [Brevibacillus reuszeri]|uniref:Uncharacterized protein n=1 Tax=Brevibacillus reuszeri TaxID=54915 RepID=A0A0K9YYK6_9BACL|nr:hypothetical protein [Brevibacillus reuszeri]KNB73741.1 hypothetical protein ADS79_07325 [Brevibacillus reuszeri]MED1858447.1 hypothetical protein [Brevibacillus reuszeri]GED69423.1 hypothetical protein BRE01_31250 [Brevibacillus reuszeri]